SLSKMRRGSQRDLGHRTLSKRREPFQRLEITTHRSENFAAEETFGGARDEWRRRDIALRISRLERLKKSQCLVGLSRLPREPRAQTAIEVASKHGRAFGGSKLSQLRGSHRRR